MSGSAGTSLKIRFTNLHNFVLHDIFEDVFHYHCRYYDDINDDVLCVCVVQVLILGNGSPAVSGHRLSHVAIDSFAALTFLFGLC